MYVIYTLMEIVRMIVWTFVNCNLDSLPEITNKILPKILNICIFSKSVCKIFSYKMLRLFKKISWKLQKKTQIFV